MYEFSSFRDFHYAISLNNIAFTVLLHTTSGGAPFSFFVMRFC